MGRLNSRITRKLQRAAISHGRSLNFKQSVDCFLFKIAWLHPENHRERTLLVQDCYHNEISTSYRTCEEENSVNFGREFPNNMAYQFSLGVIPHPKRTMDIWESNNDTAFWLVSFPSIKVSNEVSVRVETGTKKPKWRLHFEF